jgi:general secretion pathway protein D
VPGSAGPPGTQDLASAMNASFGGGTRPPLLPGIRITPDVVNNAVLIYASQENYRLIERAIVQLDRPQLQVAIDLTIAEVTLNDSLNYGVQFFLSNKFGSLINSSTSSLPTPTLPGFNAVLGNVLTPQVVVNALHGYTDVKVLSNPSLVVVDNQVATLQVGDQVPVTTGTATVLTGTNSIVNTVDYKNTGIILRVQPRINSNGNVLMDVEQEISSVANNGNQTSLTPTLSQRRVKSSIMVMSGQTVLLAGLISENQNRSRNTIPIIDQIPILGDATGTNGRAIARTELIIFIRPQIIRDGADASYVAEELRSKIRGGKIGSLEPPGAVAPFAPSIVK